MPKSKRSKIVSLTKVSKKTKEQKGAFMKDVQENADKWQYCWLFEVGNMRNAHLKTVRRLWKDSARIFFGRGAVMAKALGTTPEEEHRVGLHTLAKQIKGQVGLFFTDSPPEEVLAWFADFHQPDFARAGNKATRTVTLPAGPVMQEHTTPPEPFPHNEEPQLRKLGLRTSMKRGVPTLDMPHTVCEKGKVLTPEQTQLLKLVGIKMVMFKVGLRARWTAANGEVVRIEGHDVDVDTEGADADGEDSPGAEENEMSE
ncbi:ribosomal protein L10-domain-containing protein [Amylocystis lapponica]|nr:ribosomal protein L10-domain-containing protein [Amylocystis lapponica]